MTVSEMRALSDQDLVRMLTSLKANDSAVAWLAALVADQTALQGVQELSRRYRASVDPTQSRERPGRYTGAMTVRIDSSRWAGFFFRKRLPMNAVGPMIDRCEGWGSVIKKKAHAGFYALDELATALSMRVEDLIFEVGTDEERERLSTAL